MVLNVQYDIKRSVWYQTFSMISNVQYGIKHSVWYQTFSMVSNVQYGIKRSVWYQMCNCFIVLHCIFICNWCVLSVKLWLFSQHYKCLLSSQVLVWVYAVYYIYNAYELVSVLFKCVCAVVLNWNRYILSMGIAHYN